MLDNLNLLYMKQPYQQQLSLLKLLRNILATAADVIFQGCFCANISEIILYT